MAAPKKAAPAHKKRQSLTAEEILDADDNEHEWVPCPEWSGEICMVGLDAEDLDAFMRASTELIGKKEVRAKAMTAKLIMLCAVNNPDDRVRIFKVKEHLAKFVKKSAKPQMRLFTVGARMNGLTDEDITQLVDAGDDHDTEAEAALS